MKFKYIVDKKELKKIFVKDYQKINIFYLILSTIIFIMMTKDIIKDNLTTVLAFYLIVIILLLMLLCFINRVYASILVTTCRNNIGDFDIEIDKKNIIVNKDKKVIKKTLIKKDRIYISCDKENFVIYKMFLKNENDFDKITKELQ